MSIVSESKLGVDYLTVDSSFGRVKGFINRDFPNAAQFLGIRYAEPPTGPRRWLPPVLAAPAAEEIDAAAFGLSPPQWSGREDSVYNTEVRELRIKDETSEDCLSLCICVPEKAARDPKSAKLPVIVWITGGAFLVGGNTIPYQNPLPWVNRGQRHIVVSINYRLTIFGFPNAAGLPADKRNLGFLDQRCGLEWVHKHIASFGGDPSRLTHFGQSAGGRSIDMHTFLYPDNPLVRNVILHSGVALPPMPVNDPEHTHFSFVAKSLGFEGGDAQAELEFMRRQPWQKLIKFVEDHHYTWQEPFLSFRPIVDNHVQFDNYEERAKAGKFAKVPAIIGTTNDEGNSIAKYSPEGVDPEASLKITKNFFLGSAVKIARARSAYATTFRFLLKDFAPEGSCSWPNISPRPWMRAYHSSDMPLIFGTHDWARGPSTDLEKTLSEAWQDLYVAFAEDGPDGLKKLGWNDMSSGEGIVLGRGETGWEVVKLEEIDT